MCLPHIRLQLFTLTPIFFYYITHVHLLQFSPPSIPDILCPPAPSFARFCDTRISSLFLNGAHTSAKRKLWRYFLRQTFYIDEGVIPENVLQFYIDIWHSKHTFFSSYNFIRVPRSKNLFYNILARSGFGVFALFLEFWKMFLGFWRVFRVFWGLFLVFWGCSGF